MNMWPLLLSIYRAYGADAAKRMLTPPRKWVESVCAKTGADVEIAIQERDEAVQETLEFLESLVDTPIDDPF
jgi:hypothetical protein